MYPWLNSIPKSSARLLLYANSLQSFHKAPRLWKASWHTASYWNMEGPFIDIFHIIYSTTHILLVITSHHTRGRGENPQTFFFSKRVTRSPTWVCSYEKHRSWGVTFDRVSKKRLKADGRFWPRRSPTQIATIYQNLGVGEQGGQSKVFFLQVSLIRVKKLKALVPRISIYA